MGDLADIYEGFLNHARFCEECLTVQNDQGKLVPMVEGPAQKRLTETIDKLRAAGRPVRIIFLKARRVQVSTGTASHYFHNTPFRSGQHAAVIAHDLETATNLFSIYKRFQDNYKPFGDLIKLPALVKDADGKMEWANGSSVLIGTANALNFGRSFNLRRVHFSEAAFYKDFAALFKSVLSAVPKDPDSMVLVESTANGVGDAFHKLWLDASDPKSGSEWVALFFAWWEHPDYRMPLQIPASDFQNSLDKEEREMMPLYNLQLEQLAWRRWVIRNELGGSSASFRQEYPSNPEEAFIASGRLYFDLQSINRMPVQRDAMRGEIEINTVGVQKRITFVPREDGALTIFRRPSPGIEYMAGMDVAEGLDANQGKGEPDSDFSTVGVFERETGDQVAALRVRMQPAPFGEYVFYLMRWYNDCGLVPEANGPGLWAITEITKLGYPTNRIYHRRRAEDQDPQVRADLIGWKTTAVSRPMMLSGLDSALRDMSIVLHDAIAVRELMTFVIKPNGKPEASSGNHDDTVIATALAVVGITQMPRQERAAAAAIKRYGSRGDTRITARGSRRIV